MPSLRDPEEAAHTHRLDEFEKPESVLRFLRMFVGRYQQIKVSDVEQTLRGEETVDR